MASRAADRGGDFADGVNGTALYAAAEVSRLLNSLLTCQAPHMRGACSMPVCVQPADEGLPPFALLAPPRPTPPHPTPLPAPGSAAAFLHAHRPHRHTTDTRPARCWLDADCVAHAGRPASMHAIHPRAAPQRLSCYHDGMRTQLSPVTDTPRQACTMHAWLHLITPHVARLGGRARPTGPPTPTHLRPSSP